MKKTDKHKISIFRNHAKAATAIKVAIPNSILTKKANAEKRPTDTANKFLFCLVRSIAAMKQKVIKGKINFTPPNQLI